MIALSPSAKETDPTWGSALAFLWTIIELNTSIIVCCLPTLRAPIMGIYRKLVPVRKSQSYHLQRVLSSRRRTRSLTTQGIVIALAESSFAGSILPESRKRIVSQDGIMRTTDIQIDFDPLPAKEAERDYAGVAI